MEELLGILDNAWLTNREALLEKLTAHASYMLDRDVSDNKSIGSHEADNILSGRDDKVNVVPFAILVVWPRLDGVLLLELLENCMFGD